MGINFNMTFTESTLYYDSTSELINMYGVPLKYIRATNKNKDILLGEFQHQIYNQEDVYDIYGMLENTTMFNGQDLYSKFGIMIQDSCNIMISDKTFQSLGFTPLAGDIIYWIAANTALEVIRADNEMEDTGSTTGFYIGDRGAVCWKVVTRKHTYDNDTFNTGIDEIDNVFNDAIAADAKIPDIITTSIESILDSDEKSPWEN